ncbi:hypothetical protein MFLO_03520 [Listeria floridensis FSL S10-1187]|uniref:Tryptophan-rich sensory protein n=1 Tax=Listeria floridensis FSL S10-1187 TaxID=1265817 RepID=A0ABN0RHQ2_9LIST|nr:tryptophan-rich sensory protein [Listeria floridensis]EUJ33370.1 hypothetical protein MFLO_03520 [Listeria floridensis FSL S10-1187]
MPLIWMYLTYFTMLAVNILANLLPLNGMTTGEISDRYAALFTPAGYVFSIWGLIYLLLLLWLIGASMNYRKLDKKLMTTISISNLLNAAWIFAWHFSLIFLSLIIMFAILLSLIRIYIGQKQLARKRLWRLPFSVYLGWISVATFANISYFLAAHNSTIYEPLLTVIFILLGSVIALIFRYAQNDFVYPLIFVWAYIGIFIAQLDGNMLVRYIALICAILLFMLNWFKLKKI